MKQRIQSFLDSCESILSAQGKTLDDITIIPATKTISAEIIEQLAEYNIRYAGENKAQELLEKYPLVSKVGFHFIGQLQTNKVKYIIDKVAMIHSLDRLNLAIEIDRQAAKCGIVMPVLIEVNPARSQTKGGLSIEDAEGFLAAFEEYDNISVQGLMAVMPHIDAVGEGNLRQYYCQIATLYAKMKKMRPAFRYLSAGTSDDYRIALEYGANIIRPGRVLFGERVKSE